ncbi:MAG: hypothetical protein ABFE07_29595 [Armatimonadia bacterium]
MAVYACRTKPAARKLALAAQMDAIRQKAKDAGNVFTSKQVTQLWDLRDQQNQVPLGDLTPEIADRVRCRWVQFPQGDGTGVVETAGTVMGYTPLEGWREEPERPAPWCNPDGTVDNVKFDPAPHIGHLVKNHSDGKLAFSELRAIIVGMYEKMSSKNDDDLTAVARLQAVMAEEPLGLALSRDADLAPEILKVSKGPVPQCMEKTFLAGYGEEPKAESVCIVDDELKSSYPTIHNVPGWTPTNAFLGKCKILFSTSSANTQWKDNTIKHARTFTVASDVVLGAIIIPIWMTGALTGTVTLKVYAGNPSAPGALQCTCQVNVLELSTAVVGSNGIPFGCDNPPTLLATTGVYYYELSTDCVLDASNNFLTFYKTTAGGGAGDQNWVYSGGAWVSNTDRAGFYLCNTEAGGTYYIRTDAAFSAFGGAGGPKGAVCAATDSINATMAATVTIDASGTFKSAIVGDGLIVPALNAFPGRGALGYTSGRYGFYIYSAGVTVNWGIAGGWLFETTSYNASTLLAWVTISGTTGSPTVYTNLNNDATWANTYSHSCLVMGGMTLGTWTTKYSQMTGGSIFKYLGGYYTGYLPANLNLGNVTMSGWYNATTGYVLTTIFQGAADVTIDITLDSLTVDFTGATGVSLIFFGAAGITTAASYTGAFTVKQLKIIQAVAPAVLNMVKGIGPGAIIPPANTTYYMRPVTSKCSLQTTPQGPPAIPTGVTATDAAYGKALYVEIGNIASFSNNDCFEIGKSDGTVIGRFSKSEYTANGNKGYTWPVLTDGTGYQLKVRTTVDFAIFSDWSALADAATPTHSGWDFPAVGHVWNDTSDLVAGTYVQPDKGVVLKGTNNFGDPNAPQVPDLDLAQAIADAMKLAPSAGAPVAGSVQAKLGTPVSSVAADIATVLSAVQNVQNNTFITATIPQVLERPDAGSKSVVIAFTFADEMGTAKNLDAGNPVIALVNDDNVDKSARLGAWTNPSTGKYLIPYTNAATDDLEGLHWDVTGTINGKLRRYVAFTQLMDTTAVDFTAEDRSNLESIKTTAETIGETTVLIKTVPETVVKPAAGSYIYKLEFTLQDLQNEMVDPDDQAFGIVVKLFEGSDISQMLFKDVNATEPLDDGAGALSGYKALLRTAAGRFYCYLAVGSSDPNVALYIGLKRLVDGNAIYDSATTSITDVPNNVNTLIGRLTDERAGNLDDIPTILDGVGALADALESISDDVASLTTTVNGLVTTCGNISTAVTLIRILSQGQLEFDLEHSLAYRYNDNGELACVSTLTDKDGAAVTEDTTGPINMSRWEAV